MARVIVIPARLASQRFPGKLLQSATGWPLLRHAYERCREVRGVDRVVVAADGDEIAGAVSAFGGEHVFTDPDLPSGTDRVAAAAEALGLVGADDILVNVQGDEPEIPPRDLEILFEMLEGDPQAGVGTLVVERCDREGFADPNRVKVVLGERDRALYFTRAGAPYSRRTDDGIPERWHCHVGVYGFRPSALRAFAARGPSRLEDEERLEQLRFLEMGLSIRVAIVEKAAPGVDTIDDYRRFVTRWREQHGES